MRLEGFSWVDVPDIGKLKQKGILRRVGPDRGGRWEVIGGRGST